MSDKPSEMDQACTAIGELILWANMIDVQLTRIFVAYFALPEHGMIEPIIAELDVRKKLELIKNRLRFMRKGNQWRDRIFDWARQVEKVNDHRNVVAHHHVEIDRTGRVKLKSNQLNKVMKTIDSQMKPKPDRGLADIKRWGQEAAAAFATGEIVLQNLSQFREYALSQGGSATPTT